VEWMKEQWEQVEKKIEERLLEKSKKLKGLANKLEMIPEEL
jgi:hypothetical protein